MNSSPFPSAPADTTGTRVEVTRALSPTERWYWVADQLSTLNVCARVRVEGDMDPSALRGALASLQARHPLLRVAVATDRSGNNPRFRPTDRPVPLREVRPSSDDEDTRWLQELDGHELTAPIDWRSGPLARAVVISLPNGVHDLVMTVAHCVADGTTPLALLRRWVRLALDPAESAPAVTSRPAPPPVESLFPAHGVGTSSDGVPVDGADPGVLQRAGGRLEAERFVPFDRRRTRLSHRSLSGEALTGLTRACRREGVTVHGVLAAAMVSAVARDTAEPAPGYFTIGSPIGFRDDLDPPVSEEEVGAYVSALPSSVRYEPDCLWEMARTISGDLAERRRRGEHFASATLLEHGPAGVADSEPFVRFLEEHGPFNYFVSNIGRFDFPDTVGACRISGAQFVGGISVVGHFGASVSTCHGRLTMNFTHVEGAVSAARAERLADDSVDAVLAAALG